MREITNEEKLLERCIDTFAEMFDVELSRSERAHYKLFGQLVINELKSESKI